MTETELFADWDRATWLTALAYLAASCSTSYTFSFLLQAADVTAILHLPMAGYFFTAAICGAATLVKQRSAWDLDWLAATDAKAFLSKYTVLIAAAGALLRVSLAISEQRLPLDVSEALHLFSAPALLLILPACGLPSPSYSASASLSTLAVGMGLALNSAQVAPVGAHFATAAFILHAFLCALVKRWKMQTGQTAGTILTAYSSAAAGFTLLVFLVRTASAPSMFRLDQLLPHRYAYPLFLLSAAIEHISLINLTCRVDSIITITLLSLPRAFLAFVILPASIRSFSRSSIVAVTLLIAMAFLVHHIYVHNKKDAGLPTEASPTPPITSKRLSPLLVLLSFLPYALWITRELSLPSSLPVPSYFAAPPPNGYNSVDIVIAYWQEPIAELQEQLAFLRGHGNIMNRKPNFIAYIKGKDVSIDEFRDQTGITEVYRLPNIGREGGTYLHHILRNYNATVATKPPLQWAKTEPARDENGGFIEPKGLADQTIFLQHHLSWDWVAKPRIPLFNNRTGFLAFAPYLKMDCGEDMLGNGDFPQAANIFSVFEEQFCPPTMQLASYAGQFAVSRRRILRRAYHKYNYLWSLLTADERHWVHEQPQDFNYREQGPSSAVNPYLGHSLERSWTIIFDCNNPDIADQCDDHTFDDEKCQCLDIF